MLAVLDVCSCSLVGYAFWLALQDGLLLAGCDGLLSMLAFWVAKLAGWLGYQACYAGWLDMVASLLAALECLPTINVNLAGNCFCAGWLC
jgi:hypothetical protein